MKRPIRGVDFSDIHCGSQLGLLPPDFELADPQSLALDDAEYQLIQRRLVFNKGQAYLWKCWEDAWRWLPEEKLDFAIFNGDGLHGPATKNDKGVFGLVSRRPSVQADILKAVLKPIRHRFNDFHITAGTEWHEGEYGEALKELAANQFVDATPYPSGQLVENMLFLDWEGVLIDAAHQISYMMIYRGTAIEREMNFSRIDEALVEGAPDLILRAHTHIFHLARNRHAWGLTGPCFCLSGPYAQKRSPARGRVCDIGLVYIEIWPELKGKDDDYIIINVRRNDSPKYATIKRMRRERGWMKGRSLISRLTR